MTPAPQPIGGVRGGDHHGVGVALEHGTGVEVLVVVERPVAGSEHRNDAAALAKVAHGGVEGAAGLGHHPGVARHPHVDALLQHGLLDEGVGVQLVDERGGGIAVLDDHELGVRGDAARAGAVPFGGDDAGAVRAVAAAIGHVGGFEGGVGGRLGVVAELAAAERLLLGVREAVDGVVEVGVARVDAAVEDGHDHLFATHVAALLVPARRVGARGVRDAGGLQRGGVVAEAPLVGGRVFRGVRGCRAGRCDVGRRYRGRRPLVIGKLHARVVGLGEHDRRVVGERAEQLLGAQVLAADDRQAGGAAGVLVVEVHEGLDGRLVGQGRGSRAVQACHDLAFGVGAGCEHRRDVGGPALLRLRGRRRRGGGEPQRQGERERASRDPVRWFHAARGVACAHGRHS